VLSAFCSDRLQLMYPADGGGGGGVMLVCVGRDGHWGARGGEVPALQ
jgi:hypothetical protein